MLDIILLVVFLVMAVLGFRKGFLQSLIGLFGNVIALVVSYVLTAPVTAWISQSYGAVEYLAKRIGALLPMPDHFYTVLSSFEGMGQLYTYLEQSILPDAIKQNILEAVQEQVQAVGAGVYATMADTIAVTVATSILRGLVFIALWLLCCALLFLISRVLVGVVHLVPVVGFMDRLGGMAVSLLLTTVTLLILYKGVSVLGLMEGTLFAESEILHFCSELLNPDVTGGMTNA